jgi:hypothetical protein
MTNAINLLRIKYDKATKNAYDAEKKYHHAKYEDDNATIVYDKAKAAYLNIVAQLCYVPGYDIPEDLQKTERDLVWVDVAYYAAATLKHDTIAALRIASANHHDANASYIRTKEHLRERSFYYSFNRFFGYAFI